jgi:hypothetical protein
MICNEKYSFGPNKFHSIVACAMQLSRVADLQPSARMVRSVSSRDTSDSGLLRAADVS